MSCLHTYTVITREKVDTVLSRTSPSKPSEILQKIALTFIHILRKIVRYHKDKLQLNVSYYTVT